VESISLCHTSKGNKRPRKRAPFERVGATDCAIFTPLGPQSPTIKCITSYFFQSSYTCFLLHRLPWPRKSSLLRGAATYPATAFFIGCRCVGSFFQAVFWAGDSATVTIRGAKKRLNSPHNIQKNSNDN
jgi:hypothetical protein